MIPGLAQWVKDPALLVSSGVGCRCGLDPALLWLWNRPVAIAPIRPLDWESPYAMGAALEKAKRQEKKKKKEKERKIQGVPVMVQWLTNPTRNHEVEGLIPSLAQ